MLSEFRAGLALPAARLSVITVKRDRAAAVASNTSAAEGETSVYCMMSSCCVAFELACEG